MRPPLQTRACGGGGRVVPPPSGMRETDAKAHQPSRDRGWGVWRIGNSAGGAHLQQADAHGWAAGRGEFLLLGAPGRKGAAVTRVSLPLSPSAIARLRAGVEVRLSGRMYVARDEAHRRFMEDIRSNRGLPVPLVGELVYYMGPTPAPPGMVIGSCGPTTSSRMDRYAVALLEAGVKGMLGKGRRSADVREACQRFGAVYFITYGGCGALLNRFVRSAEVVAYAELGPEAVLRLEVEGFPAIVGIDAKGFDFYDRRRP